MMHPIHILGSAKVSNRVKKQLNVLCLASRVVTRCVIFCLALLLTSLPALANIPDFSHYDPDPNKRFSYMEDGKYSKELNIPTYEWSPVGFKEKARGCVVFVHGLTLHGQRYTVIGRAFAAGNFYALAFDMRGFGRCYADPDGKFSQNGESKRGVNYQKSFEDLVKLVTLVKKDHPDLPVILVGESLGVTPCIRLAAEHGDLVDSMVLSGAAVRVNPLMIFHPKSIKAGLRGLIIDPKFNVKLEFFMEDLVSDDPRIVDELVNDPLIRKKLTIWNLLQTDRYVSKNLKYAAKIKPEMPILLLQGSKDKCVVPKKVVQLCSDIRSDEQTLRWMDNVSHLLLETKYLKPATVEAVVSFIHSQEGERQHELAEIESDLKQVGAGEL